jgi:hypothetical protein
MMNCWICGEDGKTGEHLVKASDLKFLFGNITQMKPIYFFKSNKSPRRLQSINTNFVKSKAKICAQCNGAKTQPFDKDWQTLSEYIQKNYAQLRSNKNIKLKNVFPGRVAEAMLNVHLYFCKLFGCRATSEEIPIDIASFADAIKSVKPNDKLYIRFEVWNPKNKIAGVSKIQTVAVSNVVKDAFWYYIIGNIVVCISFNGLPAESKLNKTSWHPSKLGQYVSFKENT